MTNPIQPATDEEVERLREACVTIKGHPNSASAFITLTLIARIDAERAGAEVLRRDHTEAIDVLSSAGLAMEVHSGAPMTSHAKPVATWVAKALTESEAVRDRMRALLDAVAVAVRGPPAPNALHDHSRLPDEVAALRAECDDTTEALRIVRRNLDAARTDHDAEAAALVARAERAEAELSSARAALSQEKEGG